MSKYGFAKLGISDGEIEAAIASDAQVDAELNKKMEGEIVPVWRSHTPILKNEPGAGKRRAGAARASVQVTKKARGGKGQVGMKIWYSQMIEFGTGGKTPTPEFAPGQKTASHFGGTLDSTGGSGGGGESRKKGAKKGGKSGRGRKVRKS